MVLVNLSAFLFPCLEILMGQKSLWGYSIHIGCLCLNPEKLSKVDGERFRVTQKIRKKIYPWQRISNLGVNLFVLICLALRWGNILSSSLILVETYNANSQYWIFFFLLFLNEIRQGFTWSLGLNIIKGSSFCGEPDSSVVVLVFCFFPVFNWVLGSLGCERIFDVWIRKSQD